MKTIEEKQTEPQVALVKIDPKEFGLDEKQSLTVEQAFAPKVAEREGLRIMYEQILAKELSAETSAEAREIRLKLVPVGTGLKKIHTTQKAVAFSFGKYCDALYNAEIAPVEQMKEKLFEIEKWAEIQEEKRVAKLQAERIEILKQFEVDGSLMLVGSMTDDIWINYLLGVKLNYEKKKADEAKAETDRIELERLQAEEREAQRLENIRLKQEAELNELKLEAERKKAKSIKDKADADKAKAEAEAKKAKEQAEQAAAKAKAISDKVIADAKAKADKLAAELKAKADAEAKIKADAIKAEKLAKAAPDKIKLKELAKTISCIECGNLKSDEAQKIWQEVSILLSKVIKHIDEKTSQL